MKKTGPVPPLVGEGIVCLSSIDWDFIWQGHQEVMLRFAAAGNAVLFVENTGVRTPSLADFPRLAARLRNWWKGSSGFREQAPNLIVLSPLLLPFPYSRLACWVNARLLSRAIAKWMAATHRNAPVLWTFLPTPLVEAVVDEIDPALVVYYCIDDFAASSPAAGAVERSESRLFRRADVVMVTSLALRERARRSRDTTHVFPFGVDFEAFESARSRRGAEPKDLSGIPGPRVGYIGGIHRWVDLDLIVHAARARPSHQFVLIGPEQTDVGVLKGLSNVHLLGARPHDSLPAYIGAFDVGLIPYRLTKYTGSVYPTKLNEYFAMGIPVVSTPLPEVLAYNQSHDGLVAVADDADAFVALIDSSIEGAPLRRAQRIEAARRNSWSARFSAMSAVLAQALARRRSEPEVMKGLLRRLGLRHPRLTAALALTVAVGYGALFWTPLAWDLGARLILSEPPVSSDAIIVVAGGTGESGEIGQGYEERIGRAIELYRALYAPKILLCSGSKRAFSELEVMRAIALSNGVRDSDVLLGPRGGGTRSMLLGAELVVRERAWKRVLLVSSPYHMRRAVLTLKMLSPGLETVATPVEKSWFYNYSAAPSAGKPRRNPSWRQVRGLLQEAATLAYYRYRGWV